MIILEYPSKKYLKMAIGKPLKYQETSIFGPEVSANCTVVGSNRPALTNCGYKREFYAQVTLRDGIILAVK